MSRRSRKLKFSGREALLGAAAFSAGILVALGAINVYEQLQQARLTGASPLKPGSGDAGSHLTIAWLPDTVKRWKPQIEKYSRQYDIDPNLMAIMMTIESGGDPNADSGVAKGLMQITNPTAEDINNRLIADKKSGYDLKNPETSLEFGAIYIRYLINQFGALDHGPTWDETVSLVAAGYNGGPVAAAAYRDEKWKGLERYDMQTFNYVRYVRVMWQERHDPLSFTYRYWHDDANGKALVRNAERYKVQ
jgi:soluble lytic murein transglycosylase-like protein